MEFLRLRFRLGKTIKMQVDGAFYAPNDLISS
jgi:hypothetical protein